MAKQGRGKSPRWSSITLLLLLCLPSCAAAWNAAGHRLTASIAWDRLDPATRSALLQLLRAHPDYRIWLDRAVKGGDDERGAFIEASTWPDDIRKDKRFYSAGKDQPTPAQAGFPDMERRRHWHYHDRPLGAVPRGKPSAGVLDQQLDALARTVADPRTPLQERAYALPWLIHLVGDAHQPLHAASRYDEQGTGDDGGNALIVRTPFHPRLASMSLHSYWDDLPGPPWLRGPRLESAGRALSMIYPAPEPPGKAAQWLDESWQIARDSAYPADGDQTPTLSDAFHENAREIARRRLLEAGHRLADLLRQLLAADLKRTRPD